MKKLTKEEVLSIEPILYNKARDIDVAIYNALSDEMSKEFVLDSLMLYMNKDGGIGGGLEIDNYNPNSSVYQCYEALRILDALGFDSTYKNELYTHITNKIGNYLYNRCDIKEGLWNPTTKTNEEFAHSEVFNYKENFSKFFGVHPTAAILGFTFTLFPASKAYYKKALKQVGYIFSYIEEKNDWTEYDYISFNSLLGSLKKANLFQEEQIQLEKAILKHLEKDIENLSRELPYMLTHVKVEGLLKEALDKTLDELVDGRASHGLWEHKKGWGSNRYPEADSAMLKWLGAETVWTLYLLDSYGRIEK